jgi:S1-C subfamily serine protease
MQSGKQEKAVSNSASDRSLLEYLSVPSRRDFLWSLAAGAGLVSLSGCGGPSRKDFDDLKSEVTNLRAELDGMKGALGVVVVQYALREIDQKTLKYARDVLDPFINRWLESNQRELITLLVEAISAKAANDPKFEAGLREAGLRAFAGAALLGKAFVDPTVMIHGGKNIGSGVVCFSDKNPLTGKHETYILSAWHVVKAILKDKKDLHVIFYKDRKKFGANLDVVDKNETSDLVLLKVKGTERRFQPALIASWAEGAGVSEFDPILVVGCPVGKDPIPTLGWITKLQERGVNGGRFHVHTAPTHFGNSGGPVGSPVSRKVIGITSQIVTYKEKPISHLSYTSPTDVIHQLLNKNGFEVNQEGQVVPVKKALQIILPEPRPVFFNKELRARSSHSSD